MSGSISSGSPRSGLRHSGPPGVESDSRFLQIEQVLVLTMRLLLIGSTIFCAVGYSTSESLIASHGDSGALVVTQSGNNPIGMLFAIENNGTVADIIPIAQIVKDIGLDTVAGGSPGEVAPPRMPREDEAGF